MAKDILNYDGKICVVTGGTSGMGAAGVKILKEMGAEIYLLCNVKPSSDPTLKCIPANLGKKASIDEAVTKLPSKIDKIFSFAGVAGTKYAGREYTPAEVVTINFVGARYLIESLMPRLNENGAIAILSSIGGSNWQAHKEVLKEFYETLGFDEAVDWLNNHKNLIEDESNPQKSYVFSKEALIYYVKRRAWEIANRKIRINTVAAGATMTPMIKDFNDAFNQEGTEITDILVSPVGQYSNPEEQAKAMILLNSDAASYISGADLNVDFAFMGGALTGCTINPMNLEQQE